MSYVRSLPLWLFESPNARRGTERGEFALQLQAALTGSVDAEIARGLDRVERALFAALNDYASDLQARWRQDIAQSGLRNAGALTKTIRRKGYRNSGLDPAAVVYSNFPIIQRAFEDGGTIRSQSGNFLLVPNPDVWPTGRVPQPRRGRGNGAGAVAIAEQRFGPLRMIYRPGKVALLVAEVRASRKHANVFRRASDTARRRGELTTIIVFFLVKQVRLPRLLRGKVIRARAEQSSAAAIDRMFTAYMNRGDAPLQLGGPADG